MVYASVHWGLNAKSSPPSVRDATGPARTFGRVQGQEAPVQGKNTGRTRSGPRPVEIVRDADLMYRLVVGP